MRQKILITSALPYANGALHFGHVAGAYLPADCYARFERMRGHDVLYICGSDEYGVAITLSAELAGRTPKKHVDLFHKTNIALFNKLDISFSHFSRTTWKGHEPIVQQFFQDLCDNGYIEEKISEQLFSEQDNRFLADRYVVGSCPRCHYEEARGDECGKCGASYEATDLKKPRSKLTGSPLTRKKTHHWFLRFDLFRDKLTPFIQSRQWKNNVTSFARSYVEELLPRAITRDLSWGVPVPLENAKDKVFYVWFDAPIGYISATQEWAQKKKKPEAWKEYWLDPKTKYVQFIGKDNIPFHALFFPAMIMGQNTSYKIVDDLVANEFYNLEGRKFSKSDGWLIDLDDFFNRFHTDQIRYYLAATAPETGDAEFCWKDFQRRCNSELLGKFGNLVNRTLVFAQNHCGGKIPSASHPQERDLKFQNEMERLILEIEECYASYHLRRASQLIMEFAHAGNAYFDVKAPWKDAKEEKWHPMMETTIAFCLECIKRLAIIASPIIPGTAEKIWELLGFKKKIDTWKQAIDTSLKPGTSLPKPYVLFQKVEDTVISEELVKLNEMHKQASQKQAPPFEPLKEMISIDDFGKLDFRVGLITHAEKVEKSKKLLKLTVDIGLEKRQVISGVSHHYTPEELVGKKIILVANLKPAKLMGIESQGMILAASLDEALELVTLDDLPAGSIIS